MTTRASFPFPLPESVSLPAKLSLPVRVRMEAEDAAFVTVDPATVVAWRSVSLKPFRSNVPAMFGPDWPTSYLIWSEARRRTVAPAATELM